MKALRRLLLGAAVAWLVAGCGGGTPPAAPPAGPPARAPAPPTGAGPVNRPASPAVLPKEPEPGPALPPKAYEPRGRRDPFVAVTLTKERAGITVSTVKLVGIVQGRQGLLALVEAPDGIGYILKPDDVLGDGRVTGITANSVTFAVTGRPGERPTSLTLRLATD